VRVLVCTILALLTTPALAGAKPGYVVFPGHHEVELSLSGSNGYSLQVTKTNRFVEMFANRGPAFAVYVFRRRQAKDDAIDVDFPGVGRISVEFHPIGPPHKEGVSFLHARVARRSNSAVTSRARSEFEASTGTPRLSRTERRAKS
jgi:hypothetical protein